MTASLSESTTLEGIVRRLTAAFRSAGLEQPALDARLLVAAALDVDQVTLLRAPERVLSGPEYAAAERMADRRLMHEPVSRILGRRWFHGLEFDIDSSTLDPRPETETLVDGVLTRLRERGAANTTPIRILDLGTGSGAILIALLVALPTATGLGTDLSRPALDVARRNASKHGVADRAEFRNSNWFSSIEPATYDIVISNPPYIPSPEIVRLDRDVREFDPRAALDGGDDGLDAYRALAAGVCAYLAPAGLVAMEVGAGQALAVTALFEAAGLAPESRSAIWNDLAGHQRCVAATVRSGPNRKKPLGIGGRSS